MMEIEEVALNLTDFPAGMSRERWRGMGEEGQ